jgi:branched-chain amino acid transport system substrate-binding protein
MLIAVLAAALCGCEKKAGPTTTGGGAREVVIGFTASQTGKLSVESSRQINGVNLWIERVNEAGGVRLADGSRVRFAAKYYDDESNKERVQALYTKLITQDHAAFLISPYSTGLTDAAAMIAEQYGKIIITAGAASDATHGKGYGLAYQMYTPASRYLTGAFDLLARLDPAARTAALICEKDKFAAEVCAAAEQYARGKGLNIVLAEGYDAGAADFAPFINKIPAGVAAVMGGGHFADGSTFAKQLFEKKFAGKFIALVVAPPEPKFAELGEAARGVVGPSQWEPLAKYAAASAQAAGIEWFGPSVAEFVAAYQKKHREEPSYHAAGGYAAGLVLEKAIAAAATVETAKVKAALEAMNLMTFFGRIQFATAAAEHGLQKGHEMVYIQWQADARGQLAKQVVWPEEVKSATAAVLAR